MKDNLRLVILCCGGPMLLVWSMIGSILGGLFGSPRERIKEQR